jgi:hypothetical protein
MNINKYISEYLIYSYLYYIKNESLISDQEFDKITVVLKDNWELVENSNHPHKYLLNYNSICGSTGFDLKGKYPTIVKMTANMMINQYELDKTNKNKKINNINDLF